MADKPGTDEHLDSIDSAPWLELLKDGEFEYWQDKCDNIEKLYSDLKTLAEGGTDRQFQLFWANLEVLKPALYSRPPVPVVTPRFKNYKPIPRRASELLERALVTSLDTEDIHDTMMLCRDDLALCGRGVPWVRYETKENDDGQVYECVRYDHIDRKDFRHGPARKWKEVPWVARCEWLTRKKGLARFGDESGWLDANFSERKEDTQEVMGRMREETAPVWEIWHKEKNRVVWVAEGVEDILDAREPWLSLEGFFPCPRPAYGTLQRRMLVPVPDFLYYKDQLEEINVLTARISALAESLRMKGFYAAGSEDLAASIEKVVKDLSDTSTLVPVSNFAALGGSSLKDSIVWLPVKEVAEVIRHLVDLRKQLIDDVYQITGLSDIMRGATEPSETLGAQQLKAQYGSVRVQDRQNELIRLARDMIRLGAEIMAENFDPETLLSMAQIDDMPMRQELEQQAGQIRQQAAANIERARQDPRVMAQAQQNPEKAQAVLDNVQKQTEAQVAELMQTVTLDQVMGLLRNERIRPFVLEIESNSTIMPDEQAEKAARNEFAVAIGTMIEKIGPLVAQEPAMAPFASELLKFVAAPYRAGREMEAVIEQFADTIAAKAKQPQQPSAEAMKAQADMQKMQAETQKTQLELQLKDKQISGDQAIKTRELQLKAAEQNKRLVDENTAEMIEGREGEPPLADRLASLEARIERQTETVAAATDGIATALQGLLDDLAKRQEVALRKMMNDLASRQQRMIEMQTAQTEAIVQLRDVLAAPKDIVRDPKTQRATGVVTRMH